MSTATVASLRWALIVVSAFAFASGEAQGPVAPGLRQLRFSPDGRYVLPQDDAGITVLTVQPFAVLFRAPAQDATLADFTPDSHQILFVTSCVYSELRQTAFGAQQVWIRASPAHVERWSVADHFWCNPIVVSLPDSGTVGLSPDGSFLACEDFRRQFRMFEVATGRVVFTEKHFATETIDFCVDVTDPAGPGGVDHYCGKYDGKPGSVVIHFSPDARYMLVTTEIGGGGVAWDLRQQAPMKIRLRSHLNYGSSSPPPFTFVGPDHAMISWTKSWRKNASSVSGTLVTFPTGKVLAHPKLPPGPLFRAADPAFVIVRPCGKAAACAAEYATGQVIMSEKSPALDVLGRYYVSELAPGEVGLYERGKGLQASVALGEKSPTTGNAGAIPHD